MTRTVTFKAAYQSMMKAMQTRVGLILVFHTETRVNERWGTSQKGTCQCPTPTDKNASIQELEGQKKNRHQKDAMHTQGQNGAVCVGVRECVWWG